VRTVDDMRLISTLCALVEEAGRQTGEDGLRQDHDDESPMRQDSRLDETTTWA
jgi:hypothetical protein